ncbi:MAG: YggT family protein [Gammaproteobacteria bacterium]|nr:YggT family protein [Gammaproteobacteria bacterium]
MSYLSQALAFLIETLFGMYIFLVLLRFLLQLTHADFYNPFSQFVVRLTNAPLRPLRRLIPGFMGIDLASAVLLLMLEALKIALDALVQNVIPHLGGLLILSFADLIRMTLYVLIGAIFVRVLLGWVNPYGEHPLTDLTVHLTEPFMRPARRLLPLISGIDLSPIIVVIVFELIDILVVGPLHQLGTALL